MAQAKTTLKLIVILIVLVLLVLTFYLSKPFGKPGGVRLELDVTPNGIPRSGSWSVTSSLYNWTTGTRVIVDTSVVMTATLDDGTKTVQTKNTTSGQASFSVPSNTVAVCFNATYQTYDASTTFSGQTVVGESLACGIAISAAIVGFGFAVAAWVWYDGTKIDRWRFLFILPGLIAGGLPLAYLTLNYPTWFGTGWFPYSFLGIPVWGFVILTVVLGLPSGILAKTTRKGRSEVTKLMGNEAKDSEQK